MPAEPEVVRPTTRAQWRAWLLAHHTRATGVQVVYPKKRSAVPGISYEEIVEEALCFGWIDGTLRPVDDDVTSIWVAPRKPGGTWAASNKARVARLEAAGLMTPAGRAAVERARADGSWDALAAVDAEIIPPELVGAFERHAGSRERYDSLPPSARRQILWWVHSAKRPATRARRAELAATRQWPWQPGQT